MRYYEIRVFNDDGTDYKKGWFSSLNKDGSTNAGALNIDLDISVIPLDKPSGNAFVRIWGIPIDLIAQSSDFNLDPKTGKGKKIQIFAGMQKGLPLANPKQSGLILQGVIFQAFGNWQGNVMTLDFIIIPSSGTLSKPKNIVFQCLKEQALLQTIEKTLTEAYPDYDAPDMKISPDLVVSEDITGFYSNIEQFANEIKELSKYIKNDNTYKGVDIVKNGNRFFVDDGTTKGDVIEIKPTDFIGQPTWIDAITLIVKVVMRADIQVMNTVKMPQILGITTKASQSFVRNNLTFSGEYQVLEVRHIGSFRQPDANAWVTTLKLLAKVL